eukprot:gene9189-biopygen2152
MIASAASLRHCDLVLRAGVIPRAGTQ